MYYSFISLNMLYSLLCLYSVWELASIRYLSYLVGFTGTLNLLTHFRFYFLFHLFICTYFRSYLILFMWGTRNRRLIVMVIYDKSRKWSLTWNYGQRTFNSRVRCCRIFLETTRGQLAHNYSIETNINAKNITITKIIYEVLLWK